MDLTPQRGAFPIDLDPGQDRTRTVFFDMAATWQLDQRFGPQFMNQLFRLVGEKGEGLELVSIENLAIFLTIGLERDAREHGETPLTVEQVQEKLRPWNYAGIFRRVAYAVVGVTATPELLGKAQADGAAAQPPAAPPAARRKPANRKDPGPTKVSTMTKRSASRTRPSAGRRRSFGRTPAAS